MKIDLHVHTSRYSACGIATPEEMVEAAIESGLDGLVLTEHDVFWPRDELGRLRSEYPDIVILGGIEVSALEGHVLVYGDPGLDIADADWTLHGLFGHTLNGNCFRAIAHPFRFDESREHFEFLAGLPIQAVEIASNNTDARSGRMASELADAGGFPRIAGSDAHETKIVGKYYTVFDDEIASEEDLVRALQSGRFRPSHEGVF
jgi:predicted metal-dependent phosphoesterase TrpH